MTDQNFRGPHRNTNQTKESIAEILKSRRYGVELDPDKIDDFAPNHVSQRIAINKNNFNSLAKKSTINSLITIVVLSALSIILNFEI